MWILTIVAAIAAVLERASDQRERLRQPLPNGATK